MLDRNLDGEQTSWFIAGRYTDSFDLLPRIVFMRGIHYRFTKLAWGFWYLNLVTGTGSPSGRPGKGVEANASIGGDHNDGRPVAVQED